MKPKCIFLLSSFIGAFLFSALPAYSQIAGIGIHKSDNNSLTIWYEDGTVTVRGSYEIRDNPAAHQTFVPPSGKLATDIVGMSYSQTDKVYAWFSDLTYNTGYTAYDLNSGRGGTYTLPQGKTPGDIAGMAMDAHDKVYTWYTDKTVSVGDASNLGSIQGPVSYSLPADKSPNFIIDMDMRANGTVYTWFADGTRLRGTYRNLDQSPPAQAPAAREDENYVYAPDGKQYTKIQAGGRIWLAANLDYATQNGSWYYDNNHANGPAYGRLYTWEAANQACAALGQPWRLPKKQDWKDLVVYWGDNAYSALIEGGSSGFSARISGYRQANGQFNGLYSLSGFWSLTPYDNSSAWCFMFNSNEQQARMFHYDKSLGFSCRCVRD
ncbi:MAG: FISUMP domain-containing protein [Saprospiraceae bacterium]